MTKTDTKSSVLLKHHLKALKLPTMHAECEKIAQRCAGDNADHLAFLLQLCELELIERERKAAERRLKAARFPAAKLLDEFDFAARPSLNKPLLLQLVAGEYLDQRESFASSGISVPFQVISPTTLAPNSGTPLYACLPHVQGGAGG